MSFIRIFSQSFSPPKNKINTKRNKGQLNEVTAVYKEKELGFKT